MRRSPVVAVLLASASFSLLAPASSRAGQAPIRYFDLSQGLAGDRVWDLVLDDLGALWIATFTGISRYDGSRFRSYDTRDGLPHSNVLRLLRLPDRRILAGTAAGLAILDPAAIESPPWRAIVTEVERGGGQFANLALAPDGTAWAASNRGLFRLRGKPGAEVLESVALPGDSADVKAFALDGHGEPVVLVEGGLHRRIRGTWQAPWNPPAQLEDPVGISGIAIDPADRLWISSRRAVCVLSLSAAEPSTPRAIAGSREVGSGALEDLAAARATGRDLCAGVEQGLPPARLRRNVRIDASGSAVIVGSSGAIRVGDAGWETLLEASELERATALSVLETPGRGLWIATGERGLARRLSAGLEIEAVRDELSANVSALVGRGESMLALVGLLDPERSVIGFDARGRNDRTPPGFAGFEPSWGWGAIAERSRDGALWMGLDGGLARFPEAGRGFAAASRLAPRIQGVLRDREAIRLFEDGNAALWVSLYRPVGLVRIDRPATTRPDLFEHPEIAAFARGAATAFAEGPDGSIWCGFAQGGIARRAHGETAFRLFGDDAAQTRGFVYSLAFAPEGELWIGAGDGVYRCGATRCRRAEEAGELAQLQTFAVAWANGRLFAGTTKGVYAFTPATARLDAFTAADGLPGNGVTALEATDDGSIWAATDGGIVRLDSRPHAEPPPAVRLAALSVAGAERPLPPDGLRAVAPLLVGAGERLVDLEVAAIDLGAVSPVAYQWRVGDGRWSRPATERRLRLAGLAAGVTQIAVRAVSSSGQASADVLEMSVRVLPPFYRRAWFLGLVGASLALAAWMVHRQRIRRLLALERVRQSIAADLHDDLGSSLSRISILSEVARRQAEGRSDAEATLETIGNSARELAEMASDIVWAIDPQRDDLASWASRLRRFGEDLFAPAGVRFTVHTAEDIGKVRLAAASRRDLYLLAKEALHNAAKYAAARNVEVRAEHRAGHLHVLIEDDGVGIADGAPARAEERGGGRGLRTMRDRAQRLGALLEVGSGAAGGTRIALAIPAKSLEGA